MYTRIAAANTIAISSVGAVEPLSEWTDSIPYGHISSSYDDSNVVYTYFQVNETTIAELQYDLNTGFWEQESSSLHLGADNT